MSRLSYLFDRYCQNDCTKEELAELWTTISASSEGPLLEKEMVLLWKKDRRADDPARSVDWQELQEKIRLEMDIPETKRPVHRIHFLRTAWFRYAAAILIILGIGAYLWLPSLNKKGETANTLSPVPVQDIDPGGQRAVLTLADGSTIVLDSAANGQLATQGSAKVIKTADGQLRYDVSGSEPAGVIAFNTMRTPRGGQYQVNLPDGSKVWLNAESSITFPTRFAGKERKVSVTGEVYFEVAKNASKPFKVKIDDANEVQVLGTHFNINSYPDEKQIVTTLVEGSVRIISQSKNLTLSPGQQAQAEGNKLSLVKQADIDQVMAWKNGYFKFKRADISAIMRQLEKWYDVEIIYQDNIDEIFVATIPRTATLSNVFKALEKTGGVHFKIEGKKVTVMK